MRRLFASLVLVVTTLFCTLESGAALGTTAIQTAAQNAQAPARDLEKLPNKAGSVKFAAIGDNGNGEPAQYEVGALMARYHPKFKFEHVIMLGDNMYGSQNPKDFVRKFEEPYKALLDAGVKFYAALGNHDNQENRFYKPWNMNGERFYTYEKKNVRFFVLDTDYLDQKQRNWIERELKSSTDDWKIVYFHHPLYSSGGRHGSEVDLRVILEPLFVKYGVNVVFQGHDHIYERIKPQQGIYYFVEGSSGQLRRGDLRRSGLTAAGHRSGADVHARGDRRGRHVLSGGRPERQDLGLRIDSAPGKT